MSINPSYSPRLAWLRAAVYFAACFGIAAASGTLQTVLSQPLATAEQLANAGWIAWTLLCIAVQLWGYAYIWRKGTLHHGRPLNLLAVLVFGTLWGLAEGLLFLSVYRVFAGFLDGFWATAAAFLIIAAFLGLWHQFYWDIYVAPEHNISAWNLRKVLLAHVPNLVVTLTYVTLFGNLGIFVLLQTFALLVSTFFMRFPPFWGATLTKNQ